jgi:hypothetical protein
MGEIQVADVRAQFSFRSLPISKILVFSTRRISGSYPSHMIDQLVAWEKHLKTPPKMTMNSFDKLPVFFIPHGGGPWNVMDDYMGDPEGYGKLSEYLKKLGQESGARPVLC